VDLTLWLDLAVAGKSDVIEDTLITTQRDRTVQQLVKLPKFALVERLATLGIILHIRQRGTS